MPGLDRVVSLVRTVLGVPAAFVSAAGGGRLTVAAQRGFSPSLWVPRDGPLAPSYCRHTVERDAPLVIDDSETATLDCAGLMADSFGIRAYLGVPFRDPSGRTLGALCAVDGAPRPWSAREVEVMTTLAGMVESEIALRTEVSVRSQVEARYRSLFAESPDAILVLDPSTEEILDANAAAASLYGVDRERLIGTSARAFSPRSEAGQAAAARLLAGGAPEQFDTVQYRADGTAIDLRISASAVTLDGRRVLLSVNRDVSLQKKARRALRESDAQYRAVVEAVRDAVIETDARGHITFANSAWEQITGVPTYESLGHLARVFVHPEDRGAYDVHIAPLASGQATFVRFDSRVLRPDGEVRQVEIHTHIRYRDDGAPVGTAGIVTDITASARFQAEREARQRSEEMLRLKDSFLNNMSHELRTPLTAILGFAEILAEEVEAEHHRDFAQAVVRGGRRLRDTLNSVLDLAQLEAGGVAVDVEPVDVAAEVTEAVALLRPIADDAGLALVLDVAPATALADAAALHRVIYNLVGNAVKFTPSGAVTVAVSTDGPSVRVSVTDTGIGMEPQFLPHLFDEFTQASDGHDRTHEGVGLGLSITRQLVALMNGEISVESTPGVGTRFTVRLPATPAPAHVAPAGGRRQRGGGAVGDPAFFGSVGDV